MKRVRNADGTSVAERPPSKADMYDGQSLVALISEMNNQGKIGEEALLRIDKILGAKTKLAKATREAESEDD
jgi:hypothetical protein